MKEKILSIDSEEVIPQSHVRPCLAKIISTGIIP
jgi:hypothetical protein